MGPTALLLLLALQAAPPRPVVIASKPFGESYLLAEIFAQLLEATASMTGALRARTRGAAAGITADRMQRLRDELEAARVAVEAGLAPSTRPPPRPMPELQSAIAAFRECELSCLGRRRQGSSLRPVGDLSESF